VELPIRMPFPPMEAETAREIPVSGGDWQYEPKWDGFRCIAFRDEDRIDLQSKAGEELTRYFPEVAANLLALRAPRFVLDGELIVEHGGQLAFDELLQRIHPAESRVRKLAVETPAVLVAFDLLVDEGGRAWHTEPLARRRERLEAFAAKYFVPGHTAGVRLSPVTRDREQAQRWLRGLEGGLDGVVAKLRSEPYRSGERAGMVKVKNLRSADCVVGGFRYAQSGKVVGSLLLGLYGADGKLHHVGFTSSFAAADKAAVTKLVEGLAGGEGFTGNAPGGPSRWSRGRSTEWVPLDPKLVVEVQYDHFSGGRFRHGTKLLRWRPDKAPRQCTLAQVNCT
jgi:ATP-dependent DNA ligase